MAVEDSLNRVALECEIDADDFAELAAGHWLNRPPATWRFKGLCWCWATYAPGRIILGKEDGYRYGVHFASLKEGMMDAGIMVSRKPPARATVPILHVESISDSVRRLAQHLRAATPARVIAVTGSIGKSSSCRLLHHVLSSQGSVGSNGQFNYADGVVSEACNLGVVDYAVIEASLQSLGEATRTLRPEVALLMNVSPVHIERAGSLLNLAKQKARLFEGLSDDGAAVINGDIPYFREVLAIAYENTDRVLIFGESPAADFRLVDYDLSKQQVKADILGETVDYTLGVRGRHMALNSLGVLAAVHAIGINWKSLLGRMASATALGGRGNVETLEFGGKRVSVIDDSYNASPAAMKSAFKTLGDMAPTGGGRRVAVLGDMLELGNQSAEYHRELSNSLLQSGVDQVYLAGSLMTCLWAELPSNIQGAMCPGAGDLLRPVAKNLVDGDVILVKGSHGSDLYTLVANMRYLSLIPCNGGICADICIFLILLVRRVGPHAPWRIRRWINWQLTKLMKHKAIGTR